MEENIDLENEIEEKAKELVEEKINTQTTVVKSINDIGVNDISFSLDKEKSYEAQAEDVIGAMATVKAVTDEETVKSITEKKSKELQAKVNKRLKDAQASDLNAEVDKQEAERKKYEAVLSTFGITKHLPSWLLYTMVILFSPVFIILTIVIGIPCGIVKVLIDNIDNILVRYENAEQKNRPKIKATVWIVLVGAILCGTAFVLLKIFDKI